MASISQLTEEEKNFTRFFLLNFKVSPDIVRRFFDTVFPPKHLSQCINNSMNAIIKLNKARRINAAQLEILRGVPGTIWPPCLSPMPVGKKATSSKDFDLAMMICLLRYLGGLLTPCNGWDQLPHPNDTLPGADLSTLMWYRNQLTRTTLASMDNNEFIDKWNQVDKALASLNNGQRPHEVCEILNYDIDGKQAKTLAKKKLKQLTSDYLDCEKEKNQIDNDFSYYRQGNIPKPIAGLIQFQQ
ncbi:E3 ubiquitin-protein ligase DZIP3-like [Mytilus trossulus]|uniref:E3 ubiquitin-protein ligase DZIP3-like n=1 Tax=Mytilus trossulus TaxID=6551 RepID=UPI0030078431